MICIITFDEWLKMQFAGRLGGSVCLLLRSWSQGPGIEPPVGLPAPQEACFSVSHSPCLCSLSRCVSLCQINKILKKKNHFMSFADFLIGLLIFLPLSFEGYSRSHTQTIDGEGRIKSLWVFFFFFKDFVYLFDRERYTARERTQAGGVGEGEAGFPQSREPDAGLDPRTWDHDLSRRQTLNDWPPRRPYIKLYTVLYKDFIYFFISFFLSTL